MLSLSGPYKAFLIKLMIYGALLPFYGCGYHLSATDEPIGIEIRSLAIPLIESTSSSLGFEGDFTRAIRSEFVSHSRVPLVAKNEAAAVLVGRVYEIKTEPYSYNLYQDIVQGESVTYEETNVRWMRVKMDARLVYTKSGTVIWEEKAMEEKATFSVAGDPLSDRYSQREAVRTIARNLAQRMYLKTMGRF